MSTFLRAGIKDILIITNEADYENFRKLLGDGSQFGINIKYRIQYVQKGIADAFLIGEDFIEKEAPFFFDGKEFHYTTDLYNVDEADWIFELGWPAKLI